MVVPSGPTSFPGRFLPLRTSPDALSRILALAGLGGIARSPQGALLPEGSPWSHAGRIAPIVAPLNHAPESARSAGGGNDHREDPQERSELCGNSPSPISPKGIVGVLSRSSAPGAYRERW